MKTETSTTYRKPTTTQLEAACRQLRWLAEHDKDVAAAMLYFIKYSKKAVKTRLAKKTGGAR